MKPKCDSLLDLRDQKRAAFKDYCDDVLEERFHSLSTDTEKRARTQHAIAQQELNQYTDPLARLNKMNDLFWNGFFVFQRTISDQLKPTVPTTVVNDTKCKNK